MARFKQSIEKEIKIWKERANDEFGKILTKISELTKDILPTYENEIGIESSPISIPIANYSIVGDRKRTYSEIYNVLDDYDIIGNYPNVKRLMIKLNSLS